LCSLVVHAAFNGIRTTVADGILWLNPNRSLTTSALFGDVGALALMVKINRLRIIHTGPSSEIVVYVGFH